MGTRKESMKKYYAAYIVLMLSVFCIGSSLSTYQGGFSEAFTIFLFIISITAAGCMDMKSMKIPDKWNAVILGTALLSCVTMPEPVPVSRIIGLFCVSIPFLIGTLLAPGSFGGGDIKLMAAGGVFLGWKAALASAVIGIFLGGIWAGGCLIMGKIERKACFPLGPFLCLGMAFGVYAGNPLAECFFKI